MKNKNIKLSSLIFLFIFSLISGIFLGKNLIANSVLSDKVIKADLSKGNIDAISPGSVNRVDGHDLYVFSVAFGSKPGDLNWNVLADLDEDSVIDGNDLVILAAHFGNEAIPEDYYTIKITAGAGGSITPADPVMLKSGSSQTFTITPDTGYHVEDVQINGSSAGALAEYTFTNIASDQTMEVSFAINIYTITASRGIHGKITPAYAVAVNHGESKTFTIIPDTDSHIAGVEVDSSFVGVVTTYTFANITSDRTIKANFAENSVTITSPTDQDVHSTKNSTINLAGTSSNDPSLSSIVWSNDKGGNGTASGLADWSVSGIVLAPGDNTITVTGNYLGGVQAYDSVNITYNPSLEFSGTPNLVPDGIFINEETTVVVRIAIESNPTLDTSSVKLLELDLYNNVIETTTTLYDNGDLANGDDTTSDGVFSGKIIVNRNAEGAVKFRVSADTIDSTDTATNYSVIFDLSVYAHLTDDVFSIVLDMPENIRQKYNEFEKTYGEEEAKIKTVEWLKTQQDVIQAGVTGDCIWYVLESGISGGIDLSFEDAEQPFVQQNLNYRSTKGQLVPEKIMGFNSLEPLEGPSISNIKVGNNNVLVLSPNRSEWNGVSEEDDEAFTFEKTLYEKFKYSGFTPVKIYDKNAHVQVFKTLDKYGTIILFTHGLAGHGLGGKGFGPVYFQTGSIVNSATTKIVYGNDLRSRRLVAFNGYLFITPAFIDYYYWNKSFPNSLMYAGSCYSLHNNSMWEAFKEKGVKTYFGFSKPVVIEDDYFIALTLFHYLLDDHMTSGQAFDQVINYSNPIYNPDIFKMEGSKDLILDTTDVTFINENIHFDNAKCQSCHLESSVGLKNEYNGINFCINCHQEYDPNLVSSLVMHPLTPIAYGVTCQSCHNPCYLNRTKEYLLKKDVEVLCNDCHPIWE